MTGKQVLTDFGDNIQYEPHTLKQEHVKDDDIFVKAGQIRKLIENYMNNYVSNKYLQTNTYSKTYKLGLKLKTNDINKRDMFYIKLRETLEVLCDAIGTGDHSHQSKKKTSKLEDDSMSHLAPAIGRMPMHLNNSSGSVYNHPGMSAAAAAAGMMSHQPPPSPLLYNQMNQMMYRNPNMMNMPMSMPLQASMQMPRPGTMPMNMRQMPIGSNTSSVASMMPSRDQQLAALFNANGGNPMNAISNASATAGSSSSINNNNNNSSKVKEIEMNFVRMCSEVSDMKKEMLCLQSELNMYKSHYTKAQQHAGAATAGDEGVDFDSPKQSSWLLPVPASVAVVTNNGVTHLTSETSRMAKYIVLIPKQNRQQIRQDATHGDSNKDSLTADLMALLKTVSVQSSVSISHNAMYQRQLTM